MNSVNLLHSLDFSISFMLKMQVKMSFFASCSCAHIGLSQPVNVLRVEAGENKVMVILISGACVYVLLNVYVRISLSLKHGRIWNVWTLVSLYWLFEVKHLVLE